LPTRGVRNGGEGRGEGTNGTKSQDNLRRLASGERERKQAMAGTSTLKQAAFPANE